MQNNVDSRLRLGKVYIHANGTLMCGVHTNRGLFKKPLKNIMLTSDDRIRSEGKTSSDNRVGPTMAEHSVNNSLSWKMVRIVGIGNLKWSKRVIRRKWEKRLILKIRGRSLKERRQVHRRKSGRRIGFSKMKMAMKW